MIYGISGKTGGGKSYEAVVNHVIPTVTQQKRKVVTNLPLNVDHFCAVYGHYCRDLIEVVEGQFHNFGGERPFSKVAHYLQYEDWKNDNNQGVCFVIDECHLPLGKGKTNHEVKEFYSMSRHYGFDITLLTQNFRKVDVDIRDLVDVHYRCIKKSFMGQMDKYILKVHDRASNSTQSVINTEEREYQQKYFKFYQSHTKSAKPVIESAANDVQLWYNNWYFKGMIPMFLLAGYLVYSGFVNSKPEPVKPPTPKQAPATIPVQQIKSPGQLPHQDKNQYATVQPKQVKPEPEPQVKKPIHPFYKVQLHISGWMQNRYRGRLVKDYHITASQNGQVVFEMNLVDLALAGYKTIVRSQCSIEIQFEDYHDYLTCDYPRVNIDAGSNVPDSSDMVAGNF